MSNLQTIKDTIAEDIKKNPIMLYMKGTKLMPRCGFSSQVVNILNELEVSFEAKDVLQDEELRQGIKEFSDWPTIPQLYINGEFIGGCDIIAEMFESGELQKLVNKN